MRNAMREGHDKVCSAVWEGPLQGPVRRSLLMLGSPCSEMEADGGSAVSRVRLRACALQPHRNTTPRPRAGRSLDLRVLALRSRRREDAGAPLATLVVAAEPRCRTRHPERRTWRADDVTQRRGCEWRSILRVSPPRKCAEALSAPGDTGLPQPNTARARRFALVNFDLNRPRVCCDRLPSTQLPGLTSILATTRHIQPNPYQQPSSYTG